MKPVTLVLIKEKRELCVPLPEVVHQKQEEIYLPLGVWSAYSKNGAEGIPFLSAPIGLLCNVTSLV